MKKINVEAFRKEIEMEDKEQLLKDLETCKAIYTLHKNVANLGFDMKQLVSNDKLVGRLERFRNAKIDINEILDILTDWIVELTTKSQNPVFNETPVDLQGLEVAIPQANPFKDGNANFNETPVDLQDLEVAIPQINPEFIYLFSKGIEYFKTLGKDIIDRTCLHATNTFVPMSAGIISSGYYFRDLYQAVSNNFSLKKCDIVYNDDNSILNIKSPDSKEYIECVDRYYNDDLGYEGFRVPESGYARVTQYLDRNNKYLPYKVVYTANVKLYKDQKTDIVRVIYYNNQIENRKMHSHDYHEYTGDLCSRKIRFTDYRDENFDAIQYILDRNDVNNIQYIKDNIVQLQIHKDYDLNYKIGFYNKNKVDEKRPNYTTDWFQATDLLTLYNTVYGSNSMEQTFKKVVDKLENPTDDSITE